MAVKLSERALERLACPEGSRDKLVFDTEQKGLAVRVVSAGSKSYLVQYPYRGPTSPSAAGQRERNQPVSCPRRHSCHGGQSQRGDSATARKLQAEKVKAEALREHMTLARLVEDWDRLHLAHPSTRYRKDATSALKRAVQEW